MEDPASGKIRPKSWITLGQCDLSILGHADHIVSPLQHNKVFIRDDRSLIVGIAADSEKLQTCTIPLDFFQLNNYWQWYDKVQEDQAKNPLPLKPSTPQSPENFKPNPALICCAPAEIIAHVKTIPFPYIKNCFFAKMADYAGSITIYKNTAYLIMHHQNVVGLRLQTFYSKPGEPSPFALDKI
jgi:hypothetical protein